MKKTLQTVQMLSRLAQILSKIVFICCIVGVSGLLVGILCLAVGKDLTATIGGLTIHGYLENETGMTVGTLYTVMSTLLVLLAGEGVISKFAELYFKNECAAGTPFTFEGAKELKRLGILAISLSLGAQILASFVYGILSSVLTDVSDFHYFDGSTAAFGILFLIMSLIFRYAAQLEVIRKTELDDLRRNNTDVELK